MMSELCAGIETFRGLRWFHSMHLFPNLRMPARFVETRDRQHGNSVKPVRIRQCSDKSFYDGSFLSPVLESDARLLLQEFGRVDTPGKLFAEIFLSWFCIFLILPFAKRYCLPVNCLRLVAVCGILFCARGVPAQALKVRMTVFSSPAVVRVEGDLQNPSYTWSFRNSYGRVIGLGEHIQNFTVSDSNGQRVTVRKTRPAEFKSEKPGSHIIYDVRLSE